MRRRRCWHNSIGGKSAGKSSVFTIASLEPARRRQPLLPRLFRPWRRLARKPFSRVHVWHILSVTLCKPGSWHDLRLDILPFGPYELFTFSAVTALLLILWKPKFNANNRLGWE